MNYGQEQFATLPCLPWIRCCLTMQNFILVRSKWWQSFFTI